MMLFETRAKNLKEGALEYIKNKLDENESLSIGMENDLIRCKNNNAYVYAFYGSQIDTLSIEKLCELADKIHLLPLKYLKK